MIQVLCLTGFSLFQGRLNNVLVDMAVGDERDPTPSGGYTYVTHVHSTVS